MSEILENVMLSLVERLEKTLPAIEKLTGVNAASAVENKTVLESLSNQLAKVPAMVQVLQKQAEKLEETAKRVGEVKIPEVIKVYNHVRHSMHPCRIIRQVSNKITITQKRSLFYT
ncbi:MAG: hypothetical protein WKF97_02005 [Chitinophagaceae bacterium]